MSRGTRLVTGRFVLYAYLLLLLLSHFSHVRLCEPTRLPHPWDSPSKNTGVGCHFLLQCMIVKSEREVAQSCPTPSDPMDYSPPGPLRPWDLPGKSTGAPPKKQRHHCCSRLRLLGRPREETIQRVCCCGCCACQERRNVSEVPTAP